MIPEQPLLPLFFKMQSRPCLVVGGGRIALEKIQVLLECGTVVRAVAPNFHEEAERLARQHAIVAVRKHYETSDLEGVSFVIAATDNREVNHRVYREGVARGQLVNVVDDPEYCDFYFGSIVRRGALQVAISTTGESPAFAQQLKHEIDAALPPDTASWLARVGELRRQVNRAVEAGPERTALLRELARRETCNLAACPCRTLLPDRQAT